MIQRRTISDQEQDREDSRNHTYDCITSSQEFDLERYEPYIDVVKSLLVPSLERRILSGLERYVYNEDFHLSAQFPCLQKCVCIAESWKAPFEAFCTRYRDVNVTDDLMRQFMDYLTGEQMADRVIDSLVLNNRLNKICRELDSLQFGKDSLGHLNVLNYISEKDYWLGSGSSQTLPPSRACRAGNCNILSDLDVEAGSYICSNKCRKRPATHVCKRSYKIERHVHLPEKTFKVKDSLYTMLKNSSNIFDPGHSGRRISRNATDSNRPCGTTSIRYPKHDWKNEHLTMRIRKTYPTLFKVVKMFRPKNWKLTCYLSLPCKCENLIMKLSKVDASLSKSSQNLCQRRFETKVYNVCSCLNNLLCRMDGTVIKRICLDCEIRPNYLCFKLQPTSNQQLATSKSKVPLFAARVVTCQDLYKRNVRRESTRQGSRSQNFWASWLAQNMVKRLGDAPWTAYSGVQTAPSRENRYRDEVESVSSDLTIASCANIPEMKRVKDVGEKRSSRFEIGNLTLRNSIGRVVQKLELSPFKDREGNFSIRSKIREMLNLLSMYKGDDRCGGRGCHRSISVQAIVPSSSSRSVDIELVPVRSKISMESNVTRVISLIETRLIKSTERMHRTASIKFVRSDESKGSVRSKGSASSGGSTKSQRSVKPVKSEILNPCIMTASYESGNDDLLPSLDRDEIPMFAKSVKSVRFGSNRSKHFPNDPVVFASSVESRASTRHARQSSPIRDNSTTMNKSMNSYSFQETFSSRSIDRIKHLIRTKLCKKLLDIERYRSTVDTPKTVLSNENYFLSVPSEKTSHNRSRNDNLSGTTSDSADSVFSKSRMASPDFRKTTKPWEETDSNRKNSNAYYSDREDYTRSGKCRKRDGCDDVLNGKCFDEIAENMKHAYESAKNLRAKMNSKDANRKLKDKKDKSWKNLYNSEQNSDCSVGSVDRFDRSSCDSSEIYRFENSRCSEKPCRSPTGRNVRSKNASGRNRYNSDKENNGYANLVFPNKTINPIDSKSDFLRPKRSDCRMDGKHEKQGRPASCRNSRDSRDPKSNYRLNLLERGNLYVRGNFANLNFKDKYREQFDQIDRDFRSKLAQYVNLCKNVKYNLLKRLCPDDIYEASRSSIPSRDRYE